MKSVHLVANVLYVSL